MILQIKDEFDVAKNRWLIQLDGEADIYTVNNFKDRMYELLEEHMADIEIDCASLHYVDSTGLGAFIGLRGKLGENEKELILKNPQANVKKLLKITGLDKIFIVK